MLKMKIEEGTIKFHSPTGVPMPSDFPMSEYAKLDEQMTRRNKKTKIDDTVLTQFFGGWNAIAYRFRATAEYDESFTKAIQQSTADFTNESRYLEENALFGFFVTGLSLIESIAYSTFALCSVISPKDFPMQTDKERKKIDTRFLANRLSSEYPRELLTKTWNSFLKKPELKSWKKVRNTLAHCSSPARLVRDYAVINFQTGEMTDRSVTQEWKDFAITIEISTTSDRRKWLAANATELIRAANDFATKYF